MSIILFFGVIPMALRQFWSQSGEVLIVKFLIMTPIYLGTFFSDSTETLNFLSEESAMNLSITGSDHLNLMPLN